MYHLREKYARPALLFEAVSKPPKSAVGPLSSFGAVSHQLASEAWPEREGTSLIPLLQLNLHEVPFLPRVLQGVALLTVFVHPLPTRQQGRSGTSRVVRVYSSLDNLVEIAPPPLRGARNRRLLDLPRLVEDYPHTDDLDEQLSRETRLEFERLYPTRVGVKIGGWPKLSGAKIRWSLEQSHPAEPEYALQVDGFMEHDARIYIGRGTAAGFKNEWFVFCRSI